MPLNVIMHKPFLLLMYENVFNVFFFKMKAYQSLSMLAFEQIG